MKYLFRVLIICTVFNITACQQPSSTPDRAPLDARYNAQVGKQIQDSLRAIVTPGSFEARVTGDPYDDEIDNAMYTTGLKGNASVSVIPATDTHPATVRLSMEGHKGHSLTIDWETDSKDHQLTLARLKRSNPLDIKQAFDESYPTVHATMRENRQHYYSKSGSLHITSIDDQSITGTFFFELQPEGVSQEWFELNGAFQAEITAHKNIKPVAREHSLSEVFTYPRPLLNL